jgi:hypothetical protein
MYEIPIQFPQISICNNMPFQTEYAVEFLRKIIKEKNVLDIFDSNVMKNLTLSEKTKLIDFVYNQGLYKMNSFQDEEKKKLGHTLDFILISCMFNQEKCSVNDFEWSFHR